MLDGASFRLTGSAANWRLTMQLGHTYRPTMTTRLLTEGDVERGQPATRRHNGHRLPQLDPSAGTDVDVQAFTDKPLALRSRLRSWLRYPK
jgi:hypothetical protein